MSKLDASQSQPSTSSCDGSEIEKAANVTKINSEIFDAVWTDENCQNEVMASQRSGELDLDLRRALIQKRILKESSNFDDQEWTLTDDDFSSSFAFIKQNLKNVLPVPLIKTHQWWYKFVPNTNDPKSSKHFCKLCHKYSHKLGWANNNLPKLKDAIIIEGTLEKNTQLIRTHLKGSAHQRIVEDLKTEKRNNIQKDIEIILEEKYSANNMYTITDTVITTAYYCARLRASSECFVSFVYLLKLKGVPVGDHCKSRKVYENMLSTISEKMHDDLKYHLLGNYS